MSPQAVIDTWIVLLMLFVRIVIPIAIIMSLGYWLQHHLRPEDFAEPSRKVGRTASAGELSFRKRASRELNALPAWVPTIFLLALVGIGAGIFRLWSGLGASTNLSQASPFGLWISFNLFMLAFSTGAFALSTMIYALNLHEFCAGLRPTILTGLLGYASFTITMILGLGHWDRFFNLLMYPNISSPLALSFWCMLLFVIVLCAEFLPMGSERTRRASIQRFLKQITPWLAIAGAVLALTFQFSLATVFVIASQRVHPLWHTSLLPVLFLISSITAGLAMIIAGGTASYWVFGRSLSQALIEKLAGWVPVVLGLYVMIMFTDLSISGAPILTSGSYSILFMVELIIGTLVPAAMFSQHGVRRSRGWSFAGAALLLLGVLMNRLDVSWLSTASSPGQFYLPSLLEVLVQVGAISAAILVYTLVAHYLPLFEGLPAAERKPVQPTLAPAPAFHAPRKK